MIKLYRSFISVMAIVLTAMAAIVTDVVVMLAKASGIVTAAEQFEAEVASASQSKATDSRMPKSIGPGSGGSPLNFLSMLKAINSRHDCSFS